MKFSYQKTIDIDRRQQRHLTNAANGDLPFSGSMGLPGGIPELIHSGLMCEVPDPKGSVRPYYDLTTVGRKFVSDNFKKSSVFQVKS